MIAINADSQARLKHLETLIDSLSMNILEQVSAIEEARATGRSAQRHERLLAVTLETLRYIEQQSDMLKIYIAAIEKASRLD
ncbi:hypothetical protein SAMN06265795_104260 [Noviherbaspirillum humi]|uniref:Uncharacterized protein n=1 Tax=Noviherbaspirillum humi TaxID=1688639 RepID=A0A239G5K2_9BURK|nr:hypothetical protein [Noviherbaspirillum humi]SNS64381.1 hypothetical protein SAMN06265795_104260 [Noviherbaspirillum humi]